MLEKRLKTIQTTIVVLTVLNIIILLGYLIISLTVINNETCPSEKPLFSEEKNQIFGQDNILIHDLENKDIYFYDSSKSSVLNAKIGNNLNLEDYQEISIDTSRDNSENYKVIYSAKAKAANLILDVRTKKSGAVTCKTYDWIVNEPFNSNYAKQEFEDCFYLGNASWYGQAENKNQQFWPINDIEFKEYSPYLTGLFGDIWSSILERYWLSSNGIAVIVDQSSPLFVKKNKTSFCLLASSKEPYHNQHLIVKLKYDICQIDKSSAKTDYLNQLQLFIINNYFAKPVGIPDERMFKSPIWSTWATFKKNINETTLKAFANDILKNNFTNSQLEIDDKWQTNYGDFIFDTKKFPDMKGLITYLNNLNFRTTLWVHPFVNIEAKNFLEVSLAFLEVRAPDGLRPGITSWWDGIAAVALDMTNPNTTKWFHDQLEKIRSDTGIDSFKFDAGELNWLSRLFWLYNASFTPDQYSIEYVKMASNFGSLIEVRTGTQTQNFPIFVRMLDKDSTWGYDNGLKSVVTTALLMSILGYPFILPDMIGGNAYVFEGGEIVFETDLIAYPDYQLYIRWAQLTAFLPAMQFSIPPWHYNNRTQVPVNKICKDLVDLHEQIVYPILIEYANNAVATGEPIIRPLWWLDNSDLMALKISDEFLVGNDILVAPILDENKYKRDIYLPIGDWEAKNGTIYQGPKVLNDFPAPIEEIPYFLRKK